MFQDCHYNDKRVYNGNSYTDKTTYLYQNGPLPIVTNRYGNDFVLLAICDVGPPVGPPVFK